MTQSGAIVKALKRCLKARGMTYADLAPRLGLSEASVKRLFSNETFTLKRLERICVVLELGFSDLARMVDTPAGGLPNTLTPKQEEALAADSRLLVFFYHHLLGAPQGSIDARFAPAERERFLIRLERLDLLRARKQGRPRVLVARNVRWRLNGPLTRAYGGRIASEFIQSDFNGPNERRTFMAGRLSPASLALVSRKLDKLFAEFEELSRMDEAMDAPDTSGASDGAAARPTPLVWLMAAYRPWVFSLVPPARQ